MTCLVTIQDASPGCAGFGRPGERWDGDDPPPLERILFLLLQEYARHVGHLDIVAELVAGSTGEGSAHCGRWCPASSRAPIEPTHIVWIHWNMRRVAGYRSRGAQTERLPERRPTGCVADRASRISDASGTDWHSSAMLRKKIPSNCRLSRLLTYSGLAYHRPLREVSRPWQPHLAAVPPVRRGKAHVERRTARRACLMRGRRRRRWQKFREGLF